MYSMINGPRRNDKNKCFYKIFSLVLGQFLAFSKTISFDFAIDFVLTKRNIIDIWNINVTIIKCFALHKGLSTYLGFWNEFQNSCKYFLKYLHFIYARNEHFTIHLVPEAHKYEQNKTENTDTDYDYINRKKQVLHSES